MRSFGGGAAARVDAGALDDPLVVDADALGDRGRWGRPRRAGSGRGRGSSRCAAAPGGAVARRVAGDRVQLGRQRGARHGRVLRRGLDRTSLRMRLPIRASTLPGPTSTNAARAGLVQGEHGLAPAHGARQRVGELGAHVGERLRRSRRRRRGSAARRSRPRRARRGTAPRPAPSPASGTRRRRRAGSRGGRARAAASSARVERVAARRRARPGRARCRWRRSRRPAAAIAARVLDRARRRARASSRCAASPIRRPRRTTSSSASSRLEHAGGGQRGQLAERVAGGRRGSRSSASQPASEAQKIAGWAKRVFSSTRGEGVLADELDARARAGRARAGRPGRACQASGCPGPGRAPRVAVALLTTCTITDTATTVTPSSGDIPPAGGCDPPRQEIRPRRCAFCTASARLRTPSLRYSERRVLLDRVRARGTAAGDLAVGGARGDRLEHLALALGQRRRRRAPRAAGTRSCRARPSAPRRRCPRPASPWR